MVSTKRTEKKYEIGFTCIILYKLNGDIVVWEKKVVMARLEHLLDESEWCIMDKVFSHKHKHTHIV